MNIAILGRQPELGMAELEMLYGAEAVQPCGAGFAMVDDELPIDQLGGTVKTAKHLTTLPTADAQKVFDYCRRELPKHLEYLPEGKLKIGVSLYGFSMPLAKITANVLSLKKVIKQQGRSVRAVPNTDSALSSAQTLHNHLAGELGMELVFIRDGSTTVLGQVTGVQNIDAFAARDQARPRTDAFVGMLPPKLALMMVNMAGQLEAGARILDPFCGTGVVLQEAALRGYDVYGSDLSEKMVAYSKSNLDWLAKSNAIAAARIEVGDAMTYRWHAPIDAVITEAYLGQPFSAPPSPAKLREVVGNCDHIISSFLKNIASQLAANTPLVIAVPAWRGHNGRLTHLPLTQQIEQLGFTNVTLKTAAPPLLYYRENQIVARQLLLLKKR